MFSPTVRIAAQIVGLRETLTYLHPCDLGESAEEVLFDLRKILMDLPIVCTLTEEQMRERRRDVLEPFRAYTRQRIELANGYAYEFPPEKLLDIARLLDMERQCCQFLTFKVIVEPRKYVRLEITWPAEAKNTIADFFGS